MEGLEHTVYAAELFNKVFGKPILALLNLLGIQPSNPAHPVPDYLVMVIVVAAPDRRPGPGLAPPLAHPLQAPEPP